MNKYSPLHIGDVLLLSPSAWRRVDRDFPKDKYSERLRLGHVVQYTHDGEIAAAGYTSIPSERAALFDRQLNFPDPKLNLLQDDKVATFFDKEGNIKNEVSNFHTISHSEHLRWCREIREFDRDVIIHSFEFLDSEHTMVMYKGAISFWLCKNFLQQNQDDGSWALHRESAYLHNLV